MIIRSPQMGMPAMDPAVRPARLPAVPRAVAERATCSTSIKGLIAIWPLACRTPSAISTAIAVTALPMSIWPHAMSYFRPSSEVDFVILVTACLVKVYGAEFGLGA